MIDVTAPKMGTLPLDWLYHAIDVHAGHPMRVLIARCGHRLLIVTATALADDRPLWSGLPGLRALGHPVVRDAAGRHRRHTKRARHTPPRRTAELVDARSGQTHLLTSDALTAGRAAKGRYVALCGVEVAPAALVRGYCQNCAGASAR